MYSFLNYNSVTNVGVWKSENPWLQDAMDS